MSNEEARQPEEKRGAVENGEETAARPRERRAVAPQWPATSGGGRKAAVQGARSGGDERRPARAAPTTHRLSGESSAAGQQERICLEVRRQV